MQNLEIYQLRHLCATLQITGPTHGLVHNRMRYIRILNRFLFPCTECIELQQSVAPSQPRLEQLRWTNIEIVTQKPRGMDDMGVVSQQTGLQLFLENAERSPTTAKANQNHHFLTLKVRMSPLSYLGINGSDACLCGHFDYSSLQRPEDIS